MHPDTGILHEQDGSRGHENESGMAQVPKPHYILLAHLCMLSFKSQYRRAALGRLSVRLPKDHQEEVVSLLPGAGVCRTKSNTQYNVLALEGSKEGRLERMVQR